MDRLAYSKWQAALQAEDGSPLGQKNRRRFDDINVTTRCVGAAASADFNFNFKFQDST
jgi:hypothetical protein